MVKFIRYLKQLFFSGGRYKRLLPYFFRKASIIYYDKRNRNFLALNVRDTIDVTTCDDIFLKDAYNYDIINNLGDIDKIYHRILSNNQKPVVVDAGCNIGAATKFFERNFPDAYFFMIEPNKENLDLAKQNTGNRYKYLQAALHNTDTFCEITDPQKDNNAYTYNISETGSIQTMSPERLIAEVRKEGTPFLIKIDIEGAEKDFLINAEVILDFDVICVEIHDWLFPGQNCGYQALKLINQPNRNIYIRGENLFSVRNVI